MPFTCRLHGNTQMSKRSQTQQFASHTRRWKDESLGHKAKWITPPPNTHRRHANLGTHFSRQLCVNVSLPDTSVYHPLGPNASHSKFRSPSPTFRMCPSRFPFMLVPHPNFLFQASKAIPCLGDGLLLLQGHQRGVLPRFLLHSMPCWVSPSTAYI